METKGLNFLLMIIRHQLNARWKVIRVFQLSTVTSVSKISRRYKHRKIPLLHRLVLSLVPWHWISIRREVIRFCKKIIVKLIVHWLRMLLSSIQISLTMTKWNPSTTWSFKFKQHSKLKKKYRILKKFSRQNRIHFHIEIQEYNLMRPSHRYIRLHMSMNMKSGFTKKDGSYGRIRNFLYREDVVLEC